MVNFGQERKVLAQVWLATSVWIILNSDRIALSVMRLQVTRTAVANESSVDHDDNFVTQRLCFIHSVRRQNHGSILKLFQQFEETASRHWVNTRSWLIQEFKLRASN